MFLKGRIMKLKPFVSFVLFCALLLSLFACGEDVGGCQHQWSEWEVVKEPTCGEGGYSIRTCSICSETERNVKYPLPHSYSSSWMYDGTYHWHPASCQHTAEVSEKSTHTFSGNTCSVCGAVRATQGLSYRGNLIEGNYSVIGIGTTLDTNIVIARYYNSRDIVAVAPSAFEAVPGLESVTMQVYIKRIGDGAFKNCPDLKYITFYSDIDYLGSGIIEGCTSFESIRYYGTVAQWTKLSEGIDFGISGFIVVCNDGRVQH